ncbi:MAG: class I SAM-dependent methyltransferase [Planctomycetota bacterium]|nr:class I SAM-dependent methyltransferase [Planctomycetota bacterium]
MMVNAVCIFCNKSSNCTAIEEEGYTARRCAQCGLIYVSPRPSLEQTRQLYMRQKARASVGTDMSGALSKRLHAKHNLGILKKYAKKGALLEIGTGAGYFLNEAKREGFDVCGIELNNVQADFIRRERGIPCEDSPLSRSSFGGKTFDVVYHCNVMSHFYDPLAEFKRINSKLRNKGVLIFQTGNVGDVSRKYYDMFTTFQLPDHLFLFGENTVKELLRRSGFECMEIRRYSILPELAIQRILKRITGHKGRRTNKGASNEAGHVHASASSCIGWCGKAIKNIYHRLSHLIRYRVGYVMPKRGRPQTAVYVARKVSE